MASANEGVRRRPAAAAQHATRECDFLVGTSPSGQSAIGGELMAALPDPWFFYESDFTRTFEAPADRFEL